MTGGLIQLISVGEQDQFITGEPQITFFKSIYKRHSNFAMDTVVDTVMPQWAR